ncbi:hypothetical protein MAR_008729 [Mya arenaria]|uniref:Uncharacterized protein n=1 Tax=Mya arenaria TaxID=6604 RepID=A0ABY7E4T9_MYAAR|nr:hypothetical protein MAR_008729 [Mya arenaria]
MQSFGHGLERRLQQIQYALSGNFGVYTQWENFNPDSSGVIKYESLIDRTEAQGVINRNEALQVYTKSMMGELSLTLDYLQYLRQ